MKNYPVNNYKLTKKKTKMIFREKNVSFGNYTQYVQIGPYQTTGKNLLVHIKCKHNSGSLIFGSDRMQNYTENSASGHEMMKI